ncbi:hypothetical protein M427DRAFT_132752 [Gonapodya prolifera JEL478]|uniref:SH3 domain-containing protein n=1 Tax=Gonapodya prolifera (strain JEL478) TaxID=1344416 RepID=A0A139API1_GONPJ|nr:hypothetical protein M427DRAFT_132752 [Gonapodya prolifera JEL478]|eukprot:KXS18395.1 hypothetical protein M427DRAFT_132752 [Gonapodya prolifera JEL478]
MDRHNSVQSANHSTSSIQSGNDRGNAPASTGYGNERGNSPPSNGYGNDRSNVPLSVGYVNDRNHAPPSVGYGNDRNNAPQSVEYGNDHQGSMDRHGYPSSANYGNARQGNMHPSVNSFSTVPSAVFSSYDSGSTTLDLTTVGFPSPGGEKASSPATTLGSGGSGPVQPAMHLPPSAEDSPRVVDQTVSLPVLRNFSPKQDDEIRLNVGDVVQVWEEYNDSWCKGLNVTTNRMGMFPGGCVAPRVLVSPRPKEPVPVNPYLNSQPERSRTPQRPADGSPQRPVDRFAQMNHIVDPHQQAQQQYRNAPPPAFAPPVPNYNQTPPTSRTMYDDSPPPMETRFRDNASNSYQPATVPYYSIAPITAENSPRIAPQSPPLPQQHSLRGGPIIPPTSTWSIDSTQYRDAALSQPEFPTILVPFKFPSGVKKPFELVFKPSTHETNNWPFTRPDWTVQRSWPYREMFDGKNLSVMYSPTAGIDKLKKQYPDSHLLHFMFVLSNKDLYKIAEKNFPGKNKSHFHQADVNIFLKYFPMPIEVATFTGPTDNPRNVLFQLYVIRLTGEPYEGEVKGRFFKAMFELVSRGEWGSTHLRSDSSSSVVKEAKEQKESAVGKSKAALFTMF